MYEELEWVDDKEIFTVDEFKQAKRVEVAYNYCHTKDELAKLPYRSTVDKDLIKDDEKIENLLRNCKGYNMRVIALKPIKLQPVFSQEIDEDIINIMETYIATDEEYSDARDSTAHKFLTELSKRYKIEKK